MILAGRHMFERQTGAVIAAVSVAGLRYHADVCYFKRSVVHRRKQRRRHVSGQQHRQQQGEYDPHHRVQVNQTFGEAKMNCQK